MARNANAEPKVRHVFPLGDSPKGSGTTALSASKKNIGYLEEIAPYFHLLHAPLEGHIPFSHSILLTGKKSILIDTGLGPETVEWLRKKYKLTLVLNSHYHRDHNWGNHLFKDVPIRAHSLDAPALNSMKVYFTHMGILGRSDERQIRQETVKFIPHIKGPKVGAFEDGEVFDTGSVEVMAIHLPGHSPGHCGFIEPKSRTVFSADICCDSFGPWYGHDCSSIGDFERSIDKLVDIDPKVLVTAHTPPLRKDIRRALQTYKAKIEVRNLKLLDILKEPATFESLLVLHPLYSQIIGELKLPFRFWEEVMLRKHLKRLADEKRVRKKGKVYRTL